MSSISLSCSDTFDMNWHLELKFRRWYSRVVRLSWEVRVSGGRLAKGRIPAPQLITCATVQVQLPHLNMTGVKMNWSQAWKDFAQCRACMYPISGSYHYYSTFSWFLTHTLYIIQSLIWGQKQYLWCREGLLIPPENSGTTIPHFFFFILYCSSSTQLASDEGSLPGSFSPLFFQLLLMTNIGASGTASGSPWTRCNKQGQDTPCPKLDSAQPAVHSIPHTFFFIPKLPPSAGNKHDAPAPPKSLRLLESLKTPDNYF